MEYPEEVKLLRFKNATSVDVDYYYERGYRTGLGEISVDAYEQLQEEHNAGVHHADAYVEIINVFTADELCVPAEKFFREAKADASCMLGDVMPL